MRVLDDRKRWTAPAVRLGVLTIGVCLFGVAGVIQAGGQNTATQSHMVAVRSDPSGATIWKRDGRDYTCTSTLSPGTVELAFHGDSDIQRLRVRRFGYAIKSLDVKATDKEVAAALGQPNSKSFLLADDAPSDLKELNATLKKELEKTILADQDAFRCAPFDLNYIHLDKDKGTGAVKLTVFISLDRSFGGTAFRLASHVPDARERSRKVGQVALESGIAEILARFHRITARFPDLKVITVIGYYSTTEAALDTRTTPRTFYSHTTQTPTFALGRDGWSHQTGTIYTTTQGWTGGVSIPSLKIRKPRKPSHSSCPLPRYRTPWKIRP